MAGFRIPEFDTWRPGYAGASVSILQAGTDNLAAIFADIALTVPLANPQTLLTLESSDIQYGKWAQPVYAGSAVTVKIGSIDHTGILEKPLTDLIGVDASEAIVLPEGAVVPASLAELLSRVIYAEDYGVLDGVSAAVNTTTLTLAIGAAAAEGGGTVELPAGTFPFNTLTVPLGVRLRGQGRGVTVLQSTAAGTVIEISGDRCGFERLTLDGVLSAIGSVGVLTENWREGIFRDAEVRRFDTGIKFQGGEQPAWQGLYVENCNIGVHFLGLDNPINNVEWNGGSVTNCLTAAIRLEYDNQPVQHLHFAEVAFDNNPLQAIDIIGARFVTFVNCDIEGLDDTSSLIDIADDSPATDENTCRNITFLFCRIDTGNIELSGKCLNIQFDRCEFINVDVTLTVPENAILVTNCIEGTDFFLLGEGTKWSRWDNSEHGTSEGLTTDATATKAWGLTLKPGQVVMAVAYAVANQRNGIQTAEYYKATSAKRAGSTLNYDTQVANFTVGQLVTGAVSGAEALITADADGGATGALTIRDITGVFVDNETITDPLGGQALVNGAEVPANVSLLGAVLAVRADREDAAAWDATFVANGPELEFRVTGEASKTIEWVVAVDVTRS